MLFLLLLLKVCNSSVQKGEGVWKTVIVSGIFIRDAQVSPPGGGGNSEYERGGDARRLA